MPNYDFVCEGCSHKFEQHQSFKEEPLTKCPKCKKKKLRRLFGNGACFIVRGGSNDLGMREFYPDSAEQQLDDRLMGME